MQQQTNSQREPTHEALSENEKQQIVRSIKETYSGRSTNEVRQSQQTILAKLQNNFKVMELLFQFIKPPYQYDRNFRNACGNLIKKVFYKVSESNINKRPYINLGYEILVATNYSDHYIKENVSVGIQYIFNKDELSLYKLEYMTHAKTQIQSLIGQPEAWTIQTVQVIHGLILVFISYLNSLVQPEDQVEFVNEILTTFCKTASLCAQFAQHNIMQSVDPRLLFLASNQIFTFIQIAAERLLQQKQLISDQVQIFINQQSLTNVMIQYLFLFCEQNSLITKIPYLNQIKARILQILYLFNQHDCHINRTFMQLIFVCFRSQANSTRQNDDDDDAIDNIVCKCISILQNQMLSKNHMDFFLQNKIQIAFDLLMYCRTGPQQLQNMIQQPQKFVEMAQQFTQAFTTSPIIKIRAANFIRAFSSRIDEGLSNLVELCIHFIIDSLSVFGQSNQNSQEIRKIYSNFQFSKLESRQKLDICFMVLSVLSARLKGRDDLKAIIISIFMSRVNTIQKITDELVLLRLIRFIGYYPNAMYFSFIEQCMGYSRVFTLEGLNCFERISRNKEYFTIFPNIHIVYQKIVQYINIEDSIFERLINQNYQNILKKSEFLFISILQKIQSAFQFAVENFQMAGSKQKSIICLNYIQKMMKSQKSETYMKMIEDTEQKMENIGLKIQLFQQNFISIYETLISKRMIVDNKIQEFVVVFSDPNRLHHYPNYSQYFKLLNKFIVKSDCPQVIQLVYNNLVNYLAQTGKQKYNYAIIPQLIHCIGHMTLAYINLAVSVNFIDFLVQVALLKESKQSHLGRYQQWYVFLILHLMFKKPAAFREHLLSKNKYYAFMIFLFKTKFSCKIQRKAAVLAAVQLLIYEHQSPSRIQIIRFCINQLKVQQQKYRFRRKKNKIVEKHAQYKNENEIGEEIEFWAQNKQQQQQRMENEESKEKDNDEFLFRQFKHPFDNSCQFSMFKHRILAFINSPQTANEINQKTLPQITEVMQYEWHKNEVRKVVRISK